MCLSVQQWSDIVRIYLIKMPQLTDIQFNIGFVLYEV